MNNISSVLLAAMILFIVKRVNENYVCKILGEIGNISFEMYLLEKLILFSEVDLHGRLGNNWGGMFVGFGIVVCCAYGYHEILAILEDKVPVINNEDGEHGFSRN